MTDSRGLPDEMTLVAITLSIASAVKKKDSEKVVQRRGHQKVVIERMSGMCWSSVVCVIAHFQAVKTEIGYRLSSLLCDASEARKGRLNASEIWVPHIFWTAL
jgi:hypothetical protein